MGKTIRDRVMFNRKRAHNWKTNRIKKEILVSSIVCIVVASISLVTALMLNLSGKNEITRVYLSEAQSADGDNGTKDDSLASDVGSFLDNEAVQVNTNNDDELNLCLLGEIMMGGKVTTNLEYIYTLAFKDIFNLTKSADYTYANFSTNITSLDTINNAKSKYLVTKEAISALTTLGLDSVSIASDHITDYSKDIIQNTINTLESNEMFVAGRKDTPVYFEKGDKKIAIISTNSVIIGTSTNYTKSNISIYDLKNLKQNIAQAKQQADLVIVDIHWGREFTYGVTNEMRSMAKAMIDAGADMVIGSHALGVYPVVEYKGKPIIYSLGYLIGDSDYENAKESFVYNIKVGKDKKIESIEMIPIYIEDKTRVRLYNEYNKAKSKQILELYNRYNKENGLDSAIQGNRIKIKWNNN